MDFKGKQATTKRFGLAGLIASMVWAAGLSALAQSPTDFDLTQGYQLKAVPLSFGGAFRALADTNAAILYNPAGLAQRKGLVAAGGDYIHNGFTGSNVFGVSIVDYKAAEFIALGISYDRDTPNLGGVDVTVQQITLATATALGEMVYIGGALKGFITQVDSNFIDGPDSADLDLGLLVKPIPFLSLALTAHNLAQGKRFEEFPLQLGMGVGLTLEPHARLAIDIVRNFNTNNPGALNANFGGELRLGEGMYLRGGFGLDRIMNNNYYSVAAATMGPKIGMLFTFSQRLNPTTETYAVNVEIFF